jgi:thymidylate synthase (FAD)
VAAEHARMFLHLNHYTHWLWKQDLHNLMHFLRLRDHSHAQVEAQAFAKAVDVLLRAQLPNTMSLYDKYRRLEQE